MRPLSVPACSAKSEARTSQLKLPLLKPGRSSGQRFFLLTDFLQANAEK